MKSYSNDLRERVVKWREKGESAQEVAKRLGICKRSVERYWKTHQETGAVAPKQRGGYGRLREQCGIDLGTTALWHRLEKLGLSFKKNAARRRARPA
jgi:transposase